MIRTSGAGSAAMTTVAHAMLGIDSAFAGMEFAGRTDLAILREAMQRHGITGDFDRFVQNFEERYIPELERELRARGTAAVLPGVPELVAAVRAWPETRIGLATGNFRRAAEVKLRYFSLWEQFDGGGFAEDGEDRAHMVAAAIQRMSDGHGPARTVFVLGDSPADIAAAKANGAVAVGVATGYADAAILAATGADLVFNDLSDTETVLRLLRERAAGPA